jgi:hypothetical protein
VLEGTGFTLEFAGGEYLLYLCCSLVFVLYRIGMGIFTSCLALWWLRSLAWCFSGWFCEPAVRGGLRKYKLLPNDFYHYVLFPYLEGKTT